VRTGPGSRRRFCGTAATTWPPPSSKLAKTFSARIERFMADRMKARTIEVKALQEVALDPHHRGNR